MAALPSARSNRPEPLYDCTGRDSAAEARPRSSGTQDLPAVSIIAFERQAAHIVGEASETMVTASATAATLQPSREETELARVAARRLAPLAQAGRPATLRLGKAGREETIELPRQAVALLVQLLEAMGAGRAVAVAAQDGELTSQQAADILNVSRPFLIRLLEEGTIPFRRVGTHRRVRLEDVLRYKEATDAERRKVLDELAAEAQELRLGY